MAYPKPILPLNEADAEEFFEHLEEFEVDEGQIDEVQAIRRMMRKRSGRGRADVAGRSD